MTQDTSAVGCHRRAARTGGRGSNAAGGLAARDTEPDTVHLVSAAATPLGGDTIALRVSSSRARCCGCAQRGGDGDAARTRHG